MKPLLPSPTSPQPRGKRLSLTEQLGTEQEAVAGTLAPWHPPVLTEAKLWEEPERLLGSMEEMPLRVSLLLLLGLCALRPE